jgi:membrane protease YdiL (CAAX protease family)
MKRFLTLWTAGLPGIIAISWFALPALMAGRPLPVPMWVVSTASAVQSMLLLALAVYAGIRFAPKAGLQAPFLLSLAGSRHGVDTLRPQLVPGILGGLFGAAFLWILSRFAPEPLAQLQGQAALPLAARVLYGGITEEILVRWGLMSFLAWLFWRLTPGRSDRPSPVQLWLAIAASALAFGVMHLPAATSITGPLGLAPTLYIVAGNAVFGLVAGALYWRRGLESAIVAHMLAHALSYPLVG